MKQLWRKWLGKRPVPSQREIDALRIEFKERYHSFRQLLKANNKALALMGDLENALNGGFAFDMVFLQSRSTQISTNVFQIVRQINRLSDNRYAVLFERFKAIQRQLNPIIYPRDRQGTGPLILPLAQVNDRMVDLVGAKMANMVQACRHLGASVPQGFVITTEGFRRFMAHNGLQTEINRRLQATDIRKEADRFTLSDRLQHLIIDAPLPPELEAAIGQGFSQTFGNAPRHARVALRSSALGEDREGHAFAGQFRSILNVAQANLVKTYKAVVASKYSPTAMTYRLMHGIPDPDNAMGVGVVQMVDAISGGVVYTANPLDHRDQHMVIHAAWGLPKAVVDGSVQTDTFSFDNGRPPRMVGKQIASKTAHYQCYPEEGVCRLEVTTHDKDRPSLSDAQAAQLAQMARRLEAHFGSPQDVEWALDEDGQLHILQSRPMRSATPPTTAPASSASDERVTGSGSDSTPILEGGTVASTGAAAGEAFILERESDIRRFPKGAVLVTRQARPRWAVLLEHAAAVVTETGSIAGHLANVAREFKVPALFGVADATSRLQTGQTVTVDAGRSAIYAGRQETIIASVPSPPKVLMKGTAVYTRLEQAAERILPLRLIDPDSHLFRAGNCRSMHDITRFCHEMAVREVFNFGKEHHFDERAGKQLRQKVPLKWWVLNLDDGFRSEVRGRYVDLDEIVSTPMLALWEGITAFPWEGPPALDRKGLMAVMFQATANRNLLSTVPSAYANRNFFMISKHFCNLQSRLGFHFTTVEALVSERTAENYLVFHFKGGAADSERRLKRVQMIKDILDTHGFSVHLNQDALSARIESHEMADMLKYLRLVGYLKMHTRQLDMIMNNQAAVHHYRQKIDADVAKLL